MIKSHELPDTLSIQLPLLPSDQPIIITENIRRLFLHFETIDRNRYPSITSIIGDPGQSKTIGVNLYHELLPINSYSGSKSVILSSIRRPPTRLSVSRDLIYLLDDEPEARIYSPELMKQVLNLIIAHRIENVIFDDAERLNEDLLDFLLSLHDAKDEEKRPVLKHIVLVGNKKLEHLLRKHEKFKDRLGPSLEILPIEYEEALRKIMPNLVYEKWVYDPANKKDLELGNYVWKLVQPSFRKLTRLLDDANGFATEAGFPRITIEVIKMIQARFRGQLNTRKNKELDQFSNEDEPKTQFEVESEERHAAKDERNKRGNAG